MINVLLTGGLGYIGSNITFKLLENQLFDVIIVDSLVNSKIDKLVTLENISKRKIKFYNYDMNNIVLLESIFQENKIDIVIHLAGLKSVNESITKPILYYHNNIFITLNLLKIMEKYNCYNLIFSSSATVYGNQLVPFNENQQTGINLSNPYGKTKYIIEEILKDHYKSNPKINIIILRYFNPIGSDESGKLFDDPNAIPNNLYPYLLKVYNQELPILNIYGDNYETIDGTCARDFIHVIDLALGHIKSIDYLLEKKGFEIFNLGSGYPTSVLQIVKTFEKVNKTKINYQIVERRKGDISIMYADVSKANKLLNWSCLYNLEDMLKLH